MKLTHLLNQQLVIARMVTESGDKLIYTTVTVEMGHIQPMSDMKSEVAEGVYGKTFRLYMDGDIDIQEGDRLRDTDNNYYAVKPDGVSRRTFGSFDYLIVVLEKTD